MIRADDSPSAFLLSACPADAQQSTHNLPDLMRFGKSTARGGSVPGILVPILLELRIYTNKQNNILVWLS